MLTIRNESTLKAFLSEAKFNINFKQYYNTIISELDKEIFNCYIFNYFLVEASPSKLVEAREKN